MDITTLFNAMPGAVSQGLIWAIMGIGVYITFRILDVADLTVDGTLGLGGAVCIMCVTAGVPVWLAMVIAFAAGLLAGLATGLFHTFMGIPAILAGILTQLSLYTVNLKIMGKAVSRAYINGRLIFGENTDDALKYLSGKEVISIKVYDETPMSERHRKYKSGRKERVINVKTRNRIDFVSSGHLLASYGRNFIAAGDDSDNRYTGGGALNFFSEKLQIKTGEVMTVQVGKRRWAKVTVA